MSHQERFKQIIEESIATKNRILSDTTLLADLEKTCVELAKVLASENGKALFCGNGGSAADAQHLAAEFSGRFYKNRPALFAEALHVNTSYMTAVANDYSYDEVYARAVQGMGRKGDMLLAFSTSGNSPNILKAVLKAKEVGMTVVGFTGQAGGKMRDLCHYCFCVPSNDTPRIQESHIMLGHIICETVENLVFP
ncbi:MAG: SIS domain-containing protein [Cytophagales bacterium]|nr:MAG: SIS domain-containing protein [Cytophagales bacterium]TAF60037.1 MAG: SIS domain-containing protein [Cytophagales bacterium]